MSRKRFVFNDLTNAVFAKFTAGSYTLPVMSGFPCDQWIGEVEGWEPCAYAGLQSMLADTIIGVKTRHPDADYYTSAPTNSGEKQ